MHQNPGHITISNKISISILHDLIVTVKDCRCIFKRNSYVVCRCGNIVQPALAFRKRVPTTDTYTCIQEINLCVSQFFVEYKCRILSFRRYLSKSQYFDKCGNSRLCLHYQFKTLLPSFYASIQKGSVLNTCNY